MNQLDEKARPTKIVDHIEGNTIVLDGWGPFPKDVVIVTEELREKQEYKLVRTPNNKYLLNRK
jgi:hypothetical protein